MPSPRQHLLAQALPQIKAHGWREQVLTSLDPHAALVFPGGVLELAEFFCEQGDHHLETQAQTEDLSSFKVRERIARLVRWRLEHDDPAVVRGLIPFLAARAHLKPLWRTCDVIWRCAGDRSTDMNFYTKRTLLMGAVVSTLLFWLEDTSAHKAKTWTFLARRLDDTVHVGRLGSQTLEFLDEFLRGNKEVT